jgi:hypothetical protein
MKDAIKWTNAERMELTRRANSRTDRAEDTRRARLILLLAEGHTWNEVSARSSAAAVTSTASQVRGFDSPSRLSGDSPFRFALLFTEFISYLSIKMVASNLRASPRKCSHRMRRNKPSIT